MDTGALASLAAAGWDAAVLTVEGVGSLAASGNDAADKGAAADADSDGCIVAALAAVVF